MCTPSTPRTELSPNTPLPTPGFNVGSPAAATPLTSVQYIFHSGGGAEIEENDPLRRTTRHASTLKRGAGGTQSRPGDLLGRVQTLGLRAIYFPSTVWLWWATPPACVALAFQLPSGNGIVARRLPGLNARSDRD